MQTAVLSMTAAVPNSPAPSDWLRAILGQPADAESPGEMPPCVHVVEEARMCVNMIVYIKAHF